MGYTVKTEVFEGPFDLLLHLVNRQKVDVSTINVTHVADQYLAHIERMRDLDLDVASEFLLLAATLLEIKATSLLPRNEVYVGDELDDLSPDEARDILVARLLAYKQFKNVAAELAQRFENEARQHPRQAALEPEFLGLMPDYLEGLTLRTLALTCAELKYRREIFLLEAEHVASMPIPVESHVEIIRRALGRHSRVSFSELVGEGASREIIVVTLLAVLELYKLGVIDVVQESTFGDIAIERLDDGEAASRRFAGGDCADA